MLKKVVLVIVMSVFVCCGCGAKYECSRCGLEVNEAYYDPFREDTYYCKDCAKAYFAPMPYSAYRAE